MMQRAMIFYWLTDLNLPQGRGNFTWTELAWIHDQAFIRQHGEGWKVVSNSVVSPIQGSNQMLMATTLTRDEDAHVEDAVPDFD